jgi:hypothetical protein
MISLFYHLGTSCFIGGFVLNPIITGSPDGLLIFVNSSCKIQVLSHNLLARAARHIQEDTLLIIDPTDISKKYARHMQYLAKVRDGSAGQISDGYWVCSVVGARVDSDEIIALYQHLYSAEAPEFISENAEIFRCVDTI